MNLSKLSDFVLDWKTSDSYKNLLELLVVVRVDLTHQIKSHLVKNNEHELRLFCQPNSKCGVVVTKMLEHDLQALFVVLAHFMDFVFIHEAALFCFVVSQE